MSTIEYAVDGAVATITLNDPERRNALDGESAATIVELCRQINADQQVGAAVIRGAGGTFCSGAARDLLARAGEDPAEPERYETVGSVYEAFCQVGELAVPTVAAACGAAVGAGVNLLLATDLRIVATDLRILAGFARIGIHPGGGHFTLLGRLLDREAVAAIGLFGEEISGQQAHTLGLAWDSVPGPDVDVRAASLAARAGSDPELARRTVKSMRLELGPPAISWSAAVDVERAAQMWSLRRRHAQT